jgi:hypothetical protein
LCWLLVLLLVAPVQQRTQSECFCERDSQCYHDDNCNDDVNSRGFTLTDGGLTVVYANAHNSANTYTNTYTNSYADHTLH